MNLKRPNKALEQQIKKAVKNLSCPIHHKFAEIKMDDEKTPVEVEACCVFFKNDVLVVAERMRKDYLYRDEKTRERLEKERLREKFNR